MLAQWLKHPPRLELRIVDYKSTVLPIELQAQENCELLLRLDGSIAARSKDFTFKLYRMRQDSNLRWTCVNRLTVYCLRPLGNAYIFFISKNLNFFNKSFWIIKNLFPRFSYFQPSFFFKKKIFFNISVFLFLKSFMLFTINFNTKFSVC